MEAAFEEEKTLEGFDFTFNPEIRRSVISDLATCRFIEKRQHILISGPAGVGKTHLAQALGHDACRKGFSVLFIKTVKAFRALLAARACSSWEKQIKKYISFDLLILDDFGLTGLTPTQAEDFYELVTEKHMKSSFIITSNRLPHNWLALFPDPVMANSAMDRLSHQAHHVMITEGDSYRKKFSPQN